MLGNGLLHQFTAYNKRDPEVQPLPPTKVWLASLLASLTNAIEALQDPFQIARLSTNQIVEICGHHEALAEQLVDSDMMGCLSVSDLKKLGKRHSYVALKIIMDPTIQRYDQCLLINYFAKFHDEINQHKIRNNIRNLSLRDDRECVDDDVEYDPYVDIDELPGAKLVARCRHDTRLATHVLNTDHLCAKLSRHQLATLGGNDPIIAGIILIRVDLRNRLIPNCAPRSQAEKEALIHNNPIYFLCEKYPSTAKKVLGSSLATCLPEELLQRLNEKIKIWEELKAFCDSEAVDKLCKHVKLKGPNI